MISQRKWGRAIGALLAGTLTSAGLIVALAPAANAAPTGASAQKDCPTAVPPAFYTIGSVVPCTATFANTGTTDALVDALTEQAPWISNGNPGNGAITNISCVTAGNVTIQAGSTLPANTPCTASFNVTIPNDPALCNTFFRDRVEVDLEYPGTGPPPLTADAGATNTFAVVCPPSITVTKTASPLSKVGDAVTYNIQVCNTSLITVTKGSVVDTLIGDISADFPDTLAAGACSNMVTLSRTVLAGDPDPLTNMVTATYTAGLQSASASASATTNLFQPGVAVTKTCGPDPIQVGQAEVCTIHVTNTSSSDAPNLTQGTITDTLNGNLLDPGNTAVTASDCSATLPTGGACTITTSRIVLASDPSPLNNTVTVLYHPEGFPNNITDTATASVNIVAPHSTLAETATPLSKVTDPVTYTYTVCNDGTETVTRTSVISSVNGDITSLFPASLAVGQCATVTVTHTVVAGDADPLVDSTTATYQGIVAQA